MDDKKLDLQLIDGKRVLGSTVYKIAANMSPETRMKTSLYHINCQTYVH